MGVAGISYEMMSPDLAARAFHCTDHLSLEEMFYPHILMLMSYVTGYSKMLTDNDLDALMNKFLFVALN